MKITILGDLVPTASNAALFCSGNVEKLIGKELNNIMTQTDFRICNLETPLADNATPIPKAGPNLIAPTKAANGIKALGIDLAVLSNNHIFDQGEPGLRSTVKALEARGIAYTGCGFSQNEITKPHILEKGGLKVGIYACCEHEFSAAAEGHPGANPIDVFESFDHVSQLKKECDHVIVLFHSGREHYRYPLPTQQKIMRKFAKCGADIVVSQHSHCIGCRENYLDSELIYGQGNFLFDMRSDECWQSGLLLRVDISDKLQTEYIPIVKNGNAVKIAPAQEAEAIMDGFKDRSEMIAQAGMTEKLFSQEAKASANRYMRIIHGNSFIDRVICKLYPDSMINMLYSKKSLLGVYNINQCESHRDTLLEILDQLKK